MEFTNGIQGSWDYVELTAASLEDEGRRLSLVLWDESCTLIVEAARHEFETSAGRTPITG